MFEYSDTQFIKQYSLIKRWVTNMYSTSNAPNAYILGGQPGAGKTALQNLIRKNNKNIIVINADSFRKFHPRFNEIHKQYGNDSPKYTQPFINQVTEKLIDELSAEKYNLIIEGTLRTAIVPINTCLELKKKGYQVELHIMAVKRAISYESTILRYENAIAQGEIPRATAKQHHDMVADAISDNLDIIEKAKAFDSIKLFNRNGECLYPAVGHSSAAIVENEMLNGWWTIDETEQLKEIVTAVSDLKAARNAEDLTSYRQHTKEVITFAESNRYRYIKVSREQADQLRRAGISVEGNTEKNEISVIRIPPTQSSKAEKILYQNPNVPKK
jgi:UDP-N-acetylglucosamine kinase